MARRSQLSNSKEYCRMILMTNNQWKYDHNNEKWARLDMDCSADGHISRSARTSWPCRNPPI